MERPIDSWKKYPLFFFGDRPFPELLGVEKTCAHLDESSRERWMNSFVCLSASAETAPGFLAALEKAGVEADRVIVFLHETFSFPKKYLCLDFLPGEAMDEFRARLFSRLETLRQRKLSSELERAHRASLLQDLPAEEMVRATEQARLAHALAYAYELPPQKHGLAIQLALAAGHPALWQALGTLHPGCPNWPAEKSPWQPDFPIEALLALCAQAALQCRDNPSHFREVFREQSAQLPFRVRNELKEQTEKVLELLWGGKANVA